MGDGVLVALSGALSLYQTLFHGWQNIYEDAKMCSLGLQSCQSGGEELFKYAH